MNLMRHGFAWKRRMRADRSRFYANQKWGPAHVLPIVSTKRRLCQGKKEMGRNPSPQKMMALKSIFDGLFFDQWQTVLVL